MAGSGRRWGNIRTLPSGRIQARYTGPDGRTYTAPVTFDGKQRAEAFLRRVSGDIQNERWKPPGAAAEPVIFGTYGSAWPVSLTRRHGCGKDSTG